MLFRNLWFCLVLISGVTFADDNLSIEPSDPNVTVETEEALTLDQIQSTILEEMNATQAIVMTPLDLEKEREDKYSLLEQHIEASSLILIGQVENNESELNSTVPFVTFKLLRHIKGEDMNSTLQINSESFGESFSDNRYLLFLKTDDQNQSLYELTDSNNSALIIEEGKVYWRYRSSDKKPEKSIDDAIEQIEEIITPPEEAIPEC